MADLSYSDFRKICKDALNGGYLFMGNQAYLASNALTLARKKVLEGDITGFNHIKLDAASGEEIMYDTAICEMPMMCDKRLVELHGFDVNHSDEEDFEILINALKLLPNNPQTVFIMVCTKYELEEKKPKSKKKDSEKKQTDKKSKLERLREVLTVVDFEQEVGAALNKWIMAHLQKEGITADPSIAGAITGICGSDMYVLSGEIDKLCAYVKSQGRVTPTREDLSILTRYAIRTDFDFSNALLSGDFMKCMYIFADMKAHKEEAMVILPQISAAYVKMSKTLIASENTGSISEIAKATKLNEFVVKLHLPAAKKLGKEKLSRALELCDKADYKLKFTGVDGYVIVTRLLCQLANL